MELKNVRLNKKKSAHDANYYSHPPSVDWEGFESHHSRYLQNLTEKSKAVGKPKRYLLGKPQTGER